MGVKIDMSDLEIGGDAKILNDAKVSSKSKVDINIEKVNVKGKAEVLNELNTGKGSEVKVKIKDTTIDGNARALNNVDVAEGKLQVEVENFKTGNDVDFMNDKKISNDTVVKVENTENKKESEVKVMSDEQETPVITEVNVISLLEDNVKNLEENRNERVKEIIKEQKLDVGRDILNKRREEALAEIERHDVTEREARLDLEKIEKELEKVEIAEENANKQVTNEIRLAKKTLTEVNRLVEEKTKEQKIIEKLEKSKQEALIEMKKYDITREDAKLDLEKIEKELAERKNRLAEINTKLDKHINKLVLKNIPEEDRNKNPEQQSSDNKSQPNQPQQSNDNKPQPNQPQQPNNNKPQSNTPQQPNNNKPQPDQPQQPNNNIPKSNLQQNIGKIIGIEIVEGSDKINIAKVGEDGQIENLTIENKLKEILKNKKEIFKNPEIAKIIDEVEPSRFKQHFLKRKLSPVILNVLSENKQGSGIIDYVVAIKREENCENLKIKHDLSNTVLKGRLKRMMKRVAKTEHYIDGMEVKGLKETKTMGLLESGKRKLKNKPTTIKEGFKLVGKPFKAIGKGINAIGKETKNKFRKNIEVEKSIKDKLEAVSKSFEDEDLEKLEDKEDPDLEETEPKTQEEEQEIE